MEAISLIIQAIKVNNRLLMVQTLQQLSGEEFETTDDVWIIAEETDQQITNRLLDLLLYYQNETKEPETPEEILESILNLSHTLEDKLNYDETKEGKKWGEIVNKIQAFNRNTNL